MTWKDKSDGQGLKSQVRREVVIRAFKDVSNLAVQMFALQNGWAELYPTKHS